MNGSGKNIGLCPKFLFSQTIPDLYIKQCSVNALVIEKHKMEKSSNVFVNKFANKMIEKTNSADSVIVV